MGGSGPVRRRTRAEERKALGLDGPTRSAGSGKRDGQAGRGSPWDGSRERVS